MTLQLWERSSHFFFLRVSSVREISKLAQLLGVFILGADRDVVVEFVNGESSSGLPLCTSMTQMSSLVALRCSSTNMP